MNFNYLNCFKSITSRMAILSFVIGFSSCKEVPNSPGYEFMPDMYRTKSLEYYGEYVTKEGDTLNVARKPVPGTIARDKMPGIPVVGSGGKEMDYERSGTDLKNPLKLSDGVLADGEALYGKYCVHCHGEAGKGDGKVSAKLPGAPPAYDGPLKNLPEGKIFYSISRGKGLMGAHASMLSVEERWKLVHFVQKLQGPKEKSIDSLKVATVDTSKTGKKNP